MSEFGKYIVVEGTDGAGKTAVANLLAGDLSQEGKRVVRLDEPDSAYLAGTEDEAREALSPISIELRKIIKDGTLSRTAFTNILLFTASRLENWQAIQPELQKGTTVISARSWLSTLVYQGYAEGVDPAFIERITEEIMGTEYMHPDFEGILDLDDEVERARRIGNRGSLEKPDTFESRASHFQIAVLEGYRTVAHERGIPIISAAASQRDVANTVREHWKFSL